MNLAADWNKSSLAKTLFSDYAKSLKTGNFREQGITKLVNGKYTDNGTVKNVLEDTNADGKVDRHDAEKVIDSFVGYAENRTGKATAENTNSIHALINPPGKWSNIKLIGRDLNSQQALNAEKTMVFLNTDNKGNFQELTATPASTPATSPTPSPAPPFSTPAMVPAAQQPTPTAKNTGANPVPKATIAPLAKQPAPPIDTIRGITREQFGGIWAEDENYPSWQTTNILQAALNEKIQAGEIKIDKTTISTLLVKDGEFGAKTAEVAKAWLKANPKMTLRNLYETKAPSNDVIINVGQTDGFMFDIGSGDERNVQLVQTKLNTMKTQLGIKGLKIDGNYGPETKQAIMVFQEWYNKQAGIDVDPDEQLEVDGIAGVGTLSALGIDLT